MKNSELIRHLLLYPMDCEVLIDMNYANGGTYRNIIKASFETDKIHGDIKSDATVVILIPDR